MSSLMSLFSPMRDNLFEVYPDLQPLRAAVKVGDWSAVSTCFDQLPTRSDQAVAVFAVSQVHGSEKFLQRAVDSERDSSLARALLGTRLVQMGWDVRGGLLAQYVKQSQWKIFHDYLHRAERTLADATAIDPTNAAAWTERIVLARGLSLGIEEGRRRYEHAAEHCDVPYSAQAQMLQNLCPKWGGSLEAMQAFARKCLADGKPGTLGGAIVASAHFEQALNEGDYHLGAQYLQRRHVLDELAQAALQTVLHPDFDPATHGAVAAHSIFAYVFFVAGDYKRMAPHFAALGNRISSYPWEVWYSKRWKDVARKARRAARQW